MNWAFVVTTVAAVVVGAITNELCDLAPWLAIRLLRVAARLEAVSREERHLLFEEMSAMSDEVPGKLTKLLFAIGRLTYASRHMRFRARATTRPARPTTVLGVLARLAFFTLFGGIAAGVALAYFLDDAQVRVLNDVLGTVLVSGILLLGVAVVVSVVWVCVIRWRRRAVRKK